MTNDEDDNRYGSVNIAENNSSRLTEVKKSAVITLWTQWYRYRTEKVGHKIIKQEALQMQRYRATRHKYEISHLKRLAI